MRTVFSVALGRTAVLSFVLMSCSGDVVQLSTGQPDDAGATSDAALNRAPDPDAGAIDVGPQDGLELLVLTIEDPCDCTGPGFCCPQAEVRLTATRTCLCLYGCTDFGPCSTALAWERRRPDGTWQLLSAPSSENSAAFCPASVSSPSGGIAGPALAQIPLGPGEYRVAGWVQEFATAPADGCESDPIDDRWVFSNAIVFP